VGGWGKERKKVKWEKMEEGKGAKYIMGITRTMVLSEKKKSANAASLTKLQM